MTKDDALLLIERYGESGLRSYFEALLDYGEVLTRKSIAAWPDGTYTFEDAIDGDGFTTEPIPIRCAITVAGDSLEIDFAGSSSQVRGAINAGLLAARILAAGTDDEALALRGRLEAFAGELRDLAHAKGEKLRARRSGG